MSARSPNQIEGSTSSASARFAGVSVSGSTESFAVSGSVVDSTLGGAVVVVASINASVVVGGSVVGEDSSVSLEQAVARHHSAVAQIAMDSRVDLARTGTLLRSVVAEQD